MKSLSVLGIVQISAGARGRYECLELLALADWRLSQLRPRGKADRINAGATRRNDRSFLMNSLTPARRAPGHLGALNSSGHQRSSGHRRHAPRMPRPFRDGVVETWPMAS